MFSLTVVRTFQYYEERNLITLRDLARHGPDSPICWCCYAFGTNLGSEIAKIENEKLSRNQESKLSYKFLGWSL